MDLGAALLGLIIALLVKVGVMVLAGRILFRLYGAIHPAPTRRLWLLLPDQDLPEMRILWWALVLFAISELTCGVEIYILFRSSDLLSCAHSLTSGLGMGLFALGAYLYLDRTLIKYGGGRCLFNRICQGCTYESPQGCRYQKLILFLGTFEALACLPPFWAPTARMFADTRRYLLPFPTLNTWFDQRAVPWLQGMYPAYDPSGAAYFIPHSQLFFEYRLLPAGALLLSILGIVCVRRGHEHLGLKLLIFAFGMLAYTYFQLVLYRVTGEVLLGSLGHELVEFWFLVATAEWLSRSFGSRVLAHPVS